MPPALRYSHNATGVHAVPTSPDWVEAERHLSDGSTTASATIAAAMRAAAVRATIAVGLGAIAVIHAVDSVGKWTEVRYMFWLYMALIAASVVTAAAVLFHRSRTALLAAAALAASVIAAFVLDRTVGLPNATADIGNWLEPLGLASLVVEGFVVAIGVGGFLAAARGSR
jgi:uncharacterized membrane protein (DUF2068 family)